MLNMLNLMTPISPGPNSHPRTAKNRTRDSTGPSPRLRIPGSSPELHPPMRSAHWEGEGEASQADSFLPKRGEDKGAQKGRPTGSTYCMKQEVRFAGPEHGLKPERTNSVL